MYSLIHICSIWAISATFGFTSGQEGTGGVQYADLVSVHFKTALENNFPEPLKNVEPASQSPDSTPDPYQNMTDAERDALLFPDHRPSRVDPTWLEPAEPSGQDSGNPSMSPVPDSPPASFQDNAIASPRISPLAAIAAATSQNRDQFSDGNSVMSSATDYYSIESPAPIQAYEPFKFNIAKKTQMLEQMKASISSGVDSINPLASSNNPIYNHYVEPEISPIPDNRLTHTQVGSNFNTGMQNARMTTQPNAAFWNEINKRKMAAIVERPARTNSMLTGVNQMQYNYNNQGSSRGTANPITIQVHDNAAMTLKFPLNSHGVNQMSNSNINSRTTSGVNYFHGSRNHVRHSNSPIPQTNSRNYFNTAASRRVSSFPSTQSRNSMYPNQMTTHRQVQQPLKTPTYSVFQLTRQVYANPASSNNQGRTTYMTNNRYRTRQYSTQGNYQYSRQGNNHQYNGQGNYQYACPNTCSTFCLFGYEIDASGCNTCKCKTVALMRCPQRVCPYVCPFGYEKDSQGCQLCTCKPSPYIDVLRHIRNGPFYSSNSYIPQ